LGLERYSFIPHPLDEAKYAPAETPLRDELQRALQCDVVVLCPARHEWSNAADSKRSDRPLRAFIRYVREAETAGHPRVGLVLFEWGSDVAASKQLLLDEGVAARVRWCPPLPKLRLLEFYRAAHFMLDQFHDRVGTFGSMTAEVMSCGRPVVMFFDPERHRWCMPEMPPIVSARTEDDILARIVELAGDPARCERLGAQSRDWIERWHGWEHSTNLHLEMYRQILSDRGIAPGSPAPALIH